MRLSITILSLVTTLLLFGRCDKKNDPTPQEKEMPSCLGLCDLSKFGVSYYSAEGDSCVCIRDGDGPFGHSTTHDSGPASGGQYYGTQTSFLVGDSLFEFNFVKLFPTPPPSQDSATGASFFEERTYDYFSDYGNEEGVRVMLTDNSFNLIGSTEYGDQSGSKFEITGIENNTYNSAGYFMCTGNFKCKLYDASGNFVTKLEFGTFNMGMGMVLP